MYSEFQQGNDPNIHEFIEMNPEQEHIFYVKVTQLEPNTTDYKYEIIFVFNADEESNDKDTHKDTHVLHTTEQNKNSDNLASPSTTAKRALFQDSTDKAEKKLATVKSNQMTTKGKLD